MNSYYKILELQQYLLYFKAEPAIYKEKYLKLLTQTRRESESFLMALEDSRIEKENLMKVIKARDETILALEKKNEDSLYLVKVIQNKLGYDFTIAHASTMTVSKLMTRSAQTLYSQNHVEIQA